jgi:TonB family protein
MSLDHRPAMPWSIRLVLLLVLAGAGAFGWSKHPFVSDAKKVCYVAKLSACPSPQISLVGNECKIAWLERSMWHFSRLAQFPRTGEPGGGDFLRGLAREAGATACPEADVVDREFEKQQQQVRQAEEDRLASAQPEHESTSGGEPDEGRTAKRVRGTVKSEAPAVDGPLDPTLVAKEVRTRIGTIKACYERALKRNPSLSGRVLIRWTITAAGTVSDVEIEEDSLGDAEVASCIKRLVGRWRFPAPSGGSVDVVYPFIFEPNKEASP